MPTGPPGRALAISPAVMPMLHLPGLMMPGQFGPSSRTFGKSRFSLLKNQASSWAGTPSVMHDDELDAALGRLHHGGRARPAAGMKMQEAVAPVASHGLGDRGEDRDAVDVGAGLLGVGAGHDLGAVVPVAQAVEAALAAGEALVDDLGVLVDEDAHRSVLLQAFGQLDGRAGRLEHGRLHAAACRTGGGSRIARPSSALVPSRRMTIGRVDVDPAEGVDDAVGHLFAPGDAAEDVDEDRLHLRVVVDDLERAGHHLGVGAAADVEEVGRAAADLVDDVERAHGQPGAVGDDADVAVEADVLQALVVGRLLALVAHLGGLVLVPLVAEVGVVVEGDLGVEGVHLAGRLEDQRVDLGQVGVALGVGRGRA